MTQQQPQERGLFTSASNALADSLCQGRHMASRHLPDEQSSDASFGTDIHNALAKQDSTGLTAEQESIYESCLEIEQKLLVQFFGPEVANAKGKPVRERRLWIAWADGLQHSGQLDCIYVKGTKALVIEYKTLPGDIPQSSTNMQLRDQVCLLDWTTGTLSEIGAAVIQPLVTHSPQIAVYTKADIHKSREQMYHRVAASNNPQSPRTAGSVQCKYCKAKSSCIEYQKWSTALVKVDNRSLVDVPVSEWTPEQRKQFCDGYDAAAKWLDNAWKQMEKLAESDPNAVPGYSMQESAGKSKITNLQSVYDRLSAKGGSLQEFMKCATITKTSLTEITRAATKLKGKKLDEAVKEIIGNDFEVGASSKSLKKVKEV